MKKWWKRIAGFIALPFIGIVLVIMFLLFGDPQEEWQHSIGKTKQDRG